MSARTPDDLHGFLLLDPQFSNANKGAGQSVTQAGPEPDAPQPGASNRGYADVAQVGEALNNDGYSLLCVSPGEASNTGGGGAYAWRDDTQTDATDYRGWIAWRHLMRVERYRSGDFNDFSAARLSDGTVVFAYTSSGAGLQITHRGPNAMSWTDVVVDSAAGTATGASPTALLVVPRDGGDRLLLMHIQRSGVNPSPSDEYAIHIYASDDAGLTWDVVVAGGAGFTLTKLDLPYRMSATYHDGYITTVVHAIISGPAVTWFHVISTDMGATWTEIESYAVSTKDVRAPQVYRTPAGAVIMVYLGGGSGNKLKSATKVGPFQPFATAASWDTDIQLGNRSAYTYLSFRSTMATDDRLYIQVRETGSGASAIDLIVLNPDNPTKAYTNDRRYFDRGSFSTRDTTEILDEESSGTNVNPPVIVEYRDKLLYIGPAATQSGPSNRSIWLAEFGGYSSIDWIDAGCDAAPTGSNFGAAYIPISIPSQWGSMTMATTGAPTESITSGGFRLQLTTSDGYSANLTASSLSGGVTLNRIMYAQGVSVAAGGNITTEDIAIVGKWADGTSFMRMQIRLADTAVALREDVYGTDVFTATGLPAGAKDWLLVSSYTSGANATVGLYYRLTGSTVWTSAGTGSAAISGSGGSVTDTVGILCTYTGVSAAVDVTFGMFSLMSTNDASVFQWPLSHPDAWPSALAGRPFGTRPHDLDKGRRVYATGGPAYTNDSWDVGTRYTRGIHNIDPQISPSPDDYWQATGTTEQLIEWDMTTAERPLNGTIGIYLGGCNFRTAYLEEWNGSAWVATCTIDMASGTTGLSYTIDGRVLTAAGSGTAATRYIHMDELDGCTIVLDKSGTPKAYEVDKNSEGVWDAAHGRKPLIRLLGTMTSAASGTCDITWGHALVLVHDRATARTKYRLRIPASQYVPHDGYRIGTCLIGPMVYVPQTPDWGRSMDVVPNVDITEGRDGRRFATRRGKPRRSVDVSWPGGIDTTPVYDLDPDYWEPATGYEAAGVVADAQMLESILYRADGPLYPAVYVARAPKPTGTTQTIIGREAMVYGRIVGKVKRRAVLGQEYQSEVIAVDSVTLEEEV